MQLELELEQGVLAPPKPPRLRWRLDERRDERESGQSTSGLVGLRDPLDYTGISHSKVVAVDEDRGHRYSGKRRAVSCRHGITLVLLHLIQPEIPKRESKRTDSIS